MPTMRFLTHWLECTGCEATGIEPLIGNAEVSLWPQIPGMAMSPGIISMRMNLEFMPPDKCHQPTLHRGKGGDPTTPFDRVVACRLGPHHGVPLSKKEITTMRLRHTVLTGALTTLTAASLASAQHAPARVHDTKAQQVVPAKVIQPAAAIAAPAQAAGERHQRHLCQGGGERVAEPTAQDVRRGQGWARPCNRASECTCRLPPRAPASTHQYPLVPTSTQYTL